jgi:metal-dependent hydrolase (beta-lactamase superfamily II)
MLGDVTLEVELSEWRSVAGLVVPMRIAQREDRWLLSDLRLTSVRTNEDPGNLAATDSVRGLSPVVQSGEPAIAVNVQEIARGVWLLSAPQFNGGFYYTVAIEQSENILLVEAPENDARTLAVIAKARELRPSKPIGRLVNTHHHFDHAGGVRAAISQGLPILTHDANADFIENVVYPRRHTIRPDALERNPQPLKLTAVRDKLVLRDSMRTVEVYEATGSQHSTSILLVYLPTERMLIQADLENAVLVENVERRGLNVGTLVGLHEGPGPWPPR